MFRKNNQIKDQLVVDTSGLMDGRIQKILNLGFLNYEILIPKFVVLELQTVADKSDKIRRDRARDALSLAGEMIKSGQAHLFEQNLVKPDEVDNMLIELSRKLKAKLYTTDANLQRVAEIQSVKVLNPNELIHGIKLNFVPGENIKLKLSDRGQEKNQAVGYIDGVMIVVKDAITKIGQTVEVKISNLIETENGHIVFGELINAKMISPTKPNKSLAPIRKSPNKSNMVKPSRTGAVKNNGNSPARFKKPNHNNRRPHRETPEDKMLASIEQFGDEV
ncbi:MAG: hypothetical protein WAS94_00665 [Candidatus Saccharimonadales bacterium]